MVEKPDRDTGLTDSDRSVVRAFRSGCYNTRCGDYAADRIERLARESADLRRALDAAMFALDVVVDLAEANNQEQIHNRAVDARNVAEAARVHAGRERFPESRQDKPANGSRTERW